MVDITDIVMSRIRTWVPMAVGAGLVAGEKYVKDRWGIGITVDTAMAGTVATGLASAVYYDIARRLESHWPSLGKYLLGSARQPTYSN